MCGVFSYIGKKTSPKELVKGLKRLEYRGYDSWGVAVINDSKIEYFKTIEPIDEDKDLGLSDTNIGIAHTRWATHGGVNEINAHPHLSTDESFAVVQNGIVENFQALRTTVITEGLKIYSDTDTEIIVRLIELNIKRYGDLTEAIKASFMQLEGRNTIVILDQTKQRLIGIRQGSPLVVGVSKDAYYLASDVLSFGEKTDEIIEIDNYEMITISGKKIKKENVKTGKEIPIVIKKINNEILKIDREGYPHFMIKEIVEQQYTVKNILQYSKDDLSQLIKKIKASNKIYITGAGTAYHASAQIAYYLREIANINAIEVRCYEFSSFIKMINSDDLVIAISQSGETADTIEALEKAKEKGAEIASLVNMQGSRITQMSDHQFYSRSGPEICVASTKAFTSQIVWGYLLAKTIIGEYEQAFLDIENLSKHLNKYLDEKNFKKIANLATKLLKGNHYFVLGKGMNFTIALEAALKVKEISYKHFEGFAAGELKHGVIALVEPGTPVFGIVSSDDNKKDLENALAEVKTRGAFTIAIAREDNELYDFFINVPDCGYLDPVMNIIPFQLLAYYLAVEMGLDPDKPRNLAKSVTVK